MPRPERELEPEPELGLEQELELGLELELAPELGLELAPLALALLRLGSSAAAYQVPESPGVHL